MEGELDSLIWFFYLRSNYPECIESDDIVIAWQIRLTIALTQADGCAIAQSGKSFSNSLGLRMLMPS
jgi:hypothetical protein